MSDTFPIQKVCNGALVYCHSCHFNMPLKRSK